MSPARIIQRKSGAGDNDHLLMSMWAPSDTLSVEIVGVSRAQPMWLLDAMGRSSESEFVVLKLKLKTKWARERSERNGSSADPAEMDVARRDVVLWEEVRPLDRATLRSLQDHILSLAVMSSKYKFQGP
jgi:hypothetical protein